MVGENFVGKLLTSGKTRNSRFTRGLPLLAVKVIDVIILDFGFLARNFFMDRGTGEIRQQGIVSITGKIRVLIEATNGRFDDSRTVFGPIVFAAIEERGSVLALLSLPTPSLQLP